MMEIFSFIMLIILAFIAIDGILPIKTTFDGQAIIIIVLVLILSISNYFFGGKELEVKTEAEILERTYRNASFFEGEKYKLKIKVLEKDKDKELYINVDPFIYQKKKVSDKLSIKLIYWEFKNNEKIIKDIIITE